MAWHHATRERDGVTVRRCGCTAHEGDRWLPLTVEHFYARAGGFGYWCRACQRRYARSRWRAEHPDSKPRSFGRRATDTPAAAAALDAATAMWGLAA